LRRFLAASIAIVTLTSACKVERTPAEYFDHTERLETVREAAAEEIQDRLLAIGAAIGRGNATEAMIALAPQAEVRIVTPDPDVVLAGSDAVNAALRTLVTTPLQVEVRDVRVTVGPLGNYAWFEADMEAPGTGPGGTLLRMTGLYLRSEGTWSLVQAHVSMPAPARSPVQPDSAVSPPEA
jgi:hypothetical protein